MSDLRAFFGPNAGYVLELYDRYLADPAAVDADARAFFAALDPAEVAAALAPAGATARPAAQTAPAAFDVKRVVGAAALAQAVREYGHLSASIDPLGKPLPGAPELDPGFHGISESDLHALPPEVVGGPAAAGTATAAAAMARLRAIYSGTAGFDFDHIQVAEERLWLTDAVESQTFAIPLEPTTKKALLRRLTKVEAFEKFLHQTYLGAKRFSIEGTDILVPMLDEIVHSAALNGTREIVIGMAHRGRLNVMTHVFDKPYSAIITAFEGKKKQVAIGDPKHPHHVDPADGDATGDVKYHLGYLRFRGKHGMEDEVPMILAPNPSHLEAVNPVIEGMVRASQDICDRPGAPDRDAHASVAIALHGDASFPGQGVVAETLNLADLAGYTTGGTIHIIVNNQIGFTTNPFDSRSTLYASDLAKGFEIPIVHVNADDPEACLMAVRMAMAYRDTFGKDFLIDLVGYRRWGHNEGDEPLFTQPGMYEQIAKHPTARQVWADRLVADGVIGADEPAAILKEAMDELAAVRRSVTDGSAAAHDETPPPSPRREVDTAVPVVQLRRFHDEIHKLPAGFTMSPKLAKQWERRAAILDTPDGKLDWAHAESLAFAAIVSDGIPVRLTGQDSQRGTFSQRHLVLHDPTTGETHTPLQRLSDAKASFAVYNSPLSENAALGFEYGYDVYGDIVDKGSRRLVLWEGQFGDFSNGAQVIIDQFISAARAKWQQRPAVVLLLPHGYEGQGPEHSSARLERYLQLSAGDNIRVANCTSAAQYFHLLRRQALLLAVDPRPLIVMSPKSLLRSPHAASSIEELASGTFRPVIDDPLAAGREAEVTRLVFCSGKVAIDLDSSPLRAETPSVAIVRIEQLAPFQNSAIRGVIERYPNLRELVWLQEEPRNMGAWRFMRGRLRDMADEREIPLRYIGRIERSSPAEGSLDEHKEIQAEIVESAFRDVPAPPLNGRPRAARKNGTNGIHTAESGAADHQEAAQARTKTAVKPSTKSRS